MAYVLLIAGAVLFLTAVQGTTAKLGKLLVDDIFSTGGFLSWAVAVLVIGAVGYIRPLKGLSNAFLVLLLVVLVLSNRGFFAQFNQAIASIKSSAGSAGSNIPSIQGVLPTASTQGLG